MKSKFERLRLLILLPLLMLLFNCEKDDVQFNNETNDAAITSKIVSLNELAKMDQFSDVFSGFRAKSNDSVTRIYSAKYGFWVETGRVLLTQKENYHSFSFPVFRDTPSGKLENLFLHPYKGGYLPYLIRYDFDAKDMLDLAAGLPITDVFKKIQIMALENFDMSGLGLTLATFGEPTVGEPFLVNGVCSNYTNVTIYDDGSWTADIVACGCECPEQANSVGAVSKPGYLYLDFKGNYGGMVGSGPAMGNENGGGGGHQPPVPPNIFNPEYGSVTTPGEGFSGNPIIGVITPVVIQTDLSKFYTNLTLWQQYTLVGLDPKLLDALVVYLQKNEFSEEAKEIVKDGLDDIVNGVVSEKTLAAIFTEDLITFDNLDPCSTNVLNDLKNLTNSDIAKMITKLDASASPYLLDISTEAFPTSDGSTAQTSRTPDYPRYNYTMKLHPEFMGNANKLGRATIILHEIIHAYFLSLIDDKNAGDSNAVYEISELFDAYVTKTFGPNSQMIQHQVMANKYIDIIGRALQEYDTGLPVPTGENPNQIYTDMAWGGLIHAPVYQTLPLSDRTRLEKRTYVETTNQPRGEINPVGKPCN